MKTSNLLLFFTGTACLFATVGARAGQDVQVSTGYFDLTQAQYPPGLPTPSPWYGSPDTTFFGNAAYATSSDPDEDAILLQNLGSSPVTLSAANFGGTYDLFSLDGISSAITLAPSQYYILAGPDGSDAGFTDVVNLTLGGTAYSYDDVAAPDYPDGALHGDTQFGSGDETVPWTAIYTPDLRVSGVPDDFSTITLSALGLFALVVFRWSLATRRTVIA